MRRKIFRLLLPLAFFVSSCDIEPPLHLPYEQPNVMIEMPMVVTELEILWEVDASWRHEWHYGWDTVDESLWGKIEYPEPTNFEVRRYFLGPEPGKPYQKFDAFTVYGNRFRRRYDFGYYNLLIWSNIDSPDGTQTVIIDEKDPSSIVATTSKSRIGISNQQAREKNTHNQPEIFYAFNLHDMNISSRKEDYDYYDEEENLWVKNLHAELTPAVYMYLVQVILHHNNGRITGIGGQAFVNGLADAVNLHTGQTSANDANVTFDMRLKKGIVCEGDTCDIFGGKLTTFGLCEMPAWADSRANVVTRTDLNNSLALTFLFNSGKEGAATFDITEQMRKHVHGGVITIHIDVNDINIPGPSGSGFNPTVQDYDEENYEFQI